MLLHVGARGALGRLDVLVLGWRVGHGVVGSEVVAAAVVVGFDSHIWN